MVKFDVGAEFVASGQTMVERFAAQFASFSTEEIGPLLLAQQRPIA
jgi:hypothetical protein